ncbi:DUF2917 domain-containing protein [Roseateles sp. BYS180W]|uniref:DUF2917 domain-containing protein n=1 Tax=Roseateles rivi TaxID=3299028 RepID=A0ABW7FR05_9BURK
MTNVFFTWINGVLLAPVLSREDAGGAWWELAQAQLLRHTVGAQGLRVRVVAGRLWITPTVMDGAAPDWAMGPGDILDLPPGLVVVVEALRPARFELLVPPQVRVQMCPRPVQRPMGWRVGKLGRWRPATD